MKRSLKTVIYILIFVAIATLVIWANVTRRNSQVRGMRVSIEYGKAALLISENTLEQQIVEAMPWVLTTQVKEIDIKEIQQYILSTPYIEQCQVSISVGRRLVVRARQRRPIVRLFHGNHEFYIDVLGRHVPLSEEGDANVIVANGEFRTTLTKNYTQLDVVRMEQDSTFCHSGIVGIYKVASYLDSHPEYGALFDQIYINRTGDIFLTPKLGNHIVEIGSADNFEQKFRNLWAFYTEGMPKVGWDTYSLINLKYNNQVIGKRSH